MTTPGHMVKSAAQALGLPEMTLTLIDRELVMAGLRTKGGRGRSAAKMTARDVAHLLIGAASGEMVKDTAEKVKQFATLKNGEARPGGTEDLTWKLDGFPLPVVQALPPDHTFADALEAFIVAAKEGQFEKALELDPPKMVGRFKIPKLYHVEVRLLGPHPAAVIRLLYAGQFSEEHIYSDHPRDMAGLEEWSERFEELGYGDLGRLHWFSHSTIRAMASFLKGED